MEFSAKKKKKIFNYSFLETNIFQSSHSQIGNRINNYLSTSRDKRFDSVDNHIIFQYKVKNAGANAAKNLWFYLVLLLIKEKRIFTLQKGIFSKEAMDKKYIISDLQLGFQRFHSVSWIVIICSLLNHEIYTQKNLEIASTLFAFFFILYRGKWNKEVAICTLPRTQSAESK